MGQIPFELQHLAKAQRYQSWVTDAVTPFLGNRILEVGSGIGNHSVWLPVREKLVVTEADPNVYPYLKERLKSKFGDDPRVVTELVDLSKDWVEQIRPEEVDTIVSFNVLEHIEDDKKAMESFFKILQYSKAPKRRIVTFVPAHQWAFGSVDQSYEHFRRYSHKRLLKIVSELGFPAKIYYRYFNVVGLPGWWFMGKVSRKTEIGLAPIKSFEKIIPFVRGIDDFLHEKLRLPLGQSLLFVVEL